ncbi:MAG: glycosyltransferase family 2 protein [Actinomycetota bacterium]
MSSSPQVSVVIPAYNAARYIPRALASLEMQTYTDFEVIIVDDGSTDNTREVVAAYRGCLTIRYIYQENKHQGGARNTGFRVAKGAYITLLDTDDIYLPEKLAQQVQYLDQHTESDAVYCNVAQFFSEDPNMFYWTPWRSIVEDPVSELLRGCPINPNAIMLRRKWIDQDLVFQEDSRGRFCDEWDYFLRLAVAGCRFAHLANRLVLVEMRLDSHTQWDIQPTMKEHNLWVLNEVASRFTPEDRARFDVVSAIDAETHRLIAAYLLVGRKRDAVRALRSITKPSVSVRLTCAVASMVPKAVLQPLVRQYWSYRRKSRMVRMDPAASHAMADYMRTLERSSSVSAVSG